MISAAGKYLKPYQGLKLTIGEADIDRFRRKIPKTLSGIETFVLGGIATLTSSAGKYLKPYQGLKPASSSQCVDGRYRRKIPKTLSGIETEPHAQ